MKTAGRLWLCGSFTRRAAAAAAVAADTVRTGGTLCSLLGLPCSRHPLPHQRPTGGRRTAQPVPSLPSFNYRAENKSSRLHKLLSLAATLCGGQNHRRHFHTFSWMVGVVVCGQTKCLSGFNYLFSSKYQCGTTTEAINECYMHTHNIHFPHSVVNT